MGKFDGKRKQFTRVLPSGVPVTLRVFIADHQDWITKNDEETRRNGIDKMLRDCVVKLGNVDNPDRELLDKFLTNDRAYALFQIRQESNTLNPNFLFNYEFPVGADGKKRVKRFEVIFNREDFPQKPYKWVYDRMVEDYKKSLDKPDTYELSRNEESDILLNEFPVVYENYEQMLAEQSKRKVTLPDSEAVVHWTLLDAKQERQYGRNKKASSISSHDQVLQHKPQYEEEGYQDGDKLLDLPIGKMTLQDIEVLRGDILDTMGKIETSVVVDFNGDPTTITQLNLIAVPAFFFPSLAI